MGETGAREGMSGGVDALEREFERVRAVLEVVCYAAASG
jgi:hypothetical protein